MTCRSTLFLLLCMTLVAASEESRGAAPSIPGVNGIIEAHSNFDDGKIEPFFSCTTQKPNRVEIVSSTDTRRSGSDMRFFWQSSSWNGTRMTKGAEACSNVRVSQSGWFAFLFYLSDSEFPRDKKSVVAQIFQPGKCNSWASVLEMSGDDLSIMHRSHCGKVPGQVIFRSFPRNRWVPIIWRFVASGRDKGQVSVWIDNFDRASPNFIAKDISFGFGDFDSVDRLPQSQQFTLKFGQYNYDIANYVSSETRVSRYDNVLQIGSESSDSWGIIVEFLKQGSKSGAQKNR